MDDSRTTRRIAIAAIVLALVGVGLAAIRFVMPATASCQEASWDARPAAADLPAGFSLSASQYDLNRQQVTFLGPFPEDETTAQGVVYATVTCFDEGAADAVARSEQAARDANQAVIPRDDLGDGGFSATDEGGSTFLQLRHGDVVVYLAASSDVAASDVDALASAYDKALGGDGGAVAVGTADPGVLPSDDPLASALPSDGAPSDPPAAPELEALLPAQVDGTALAVDSVLGPELFGEDPSSRAIIAALRAQGKTAADISFAQAYDETQALDLSMFAVAVDALGVDKTKEIVLDAWLSATGAGIEREEVTLGGREVTRIDYGDDGAKDYLVTSGDAVIVVSSGDEAVATAAIDALP
ncbi:MAG TPA: hypothetical protein VFY23_16480 [Candidatus Limnocylindrales bacterium]|nr:hypothetical protein [Candidatus Limnocylindrales bacterium]